MATPYFMNWCCPHSLFTRPLDASPIVFCMNEGPEYFRIRSMIEEGGGVLEKARKFDQSGMRIRIHDRRMVALEKDSDLFDYQYIEDCVKEDELLRNLDSYRLGKSLFTDYDPYDILLGESKWSHLRRSTDSSDGSIVSELLDVACPSTSAPRPYTFGDQVSILQYIIQHQKYNALTQIQTWRDMAKDGIGCGLRSGNSLREHFKRQILPKIHVKTFPQFREEDLNQIIQGWSSQKQEYYAPSLPSNIQVVERTPKNKRPSQKQHRVNFNIPDDDDQEDRDNEKKDKQTLKTRSSLSSALEKTRIDDSMIVEEVDSEDEEGSPINKKRRVSRLESPPESPTCAISISLKASQIFSNEIPEEGAALSQSSHSPIRIENYFDTFPPEVMDFLEKGPTVIASSNESTEKKGSNPNNGKQLQTELQEEEEERERSEDEIISGALSETAPVRSKKGKGGTSSYPTRVSQSLDFNYSSQTPFNPPMQSTQKDYENTVMDKYSAPLTRKKDPSSKKPNSVNSSPKNITSEITGSRTELSIHKTTKGHESNGHQDSEQVRISLEEYGKKIKQCLQKTNVVKVSLRRLSSSEINQKPHHSNKEDFSLRKLRVKSSKESEDPIPSVTRRGRKREKPVVPKRTTPKKKKLYSEKKEAVPEIFTPLDKDAASKATVPLVPPSMPNTISETLPDLLFDEIEDEVENVPPIEKNNEAKEKSPPPPAQSEEEEYISNSRSKRSKPKKSSTLKEYFPLKGKDTPNTSLNYTEQEDRILVQLLEKGRVSGSDIKGLYKSKTLPGRSLKSIKNRLSELKETQKKKKNMNKKRDKRNSISSPFSSSEDQEIVNWITKRHCFGALTGTLIWKRIAGENVLPHRSADDIYKRFMSHIYPNISSYNLSKEMEAKFTLALK